MIPSKFVEKYGEALPETVFLKPPNGAAWKISLVKNGNKIWFQKGWKEFSEHHSLGHGHLLLFRYQGTSTFRVHIFGMSALEIKYPLNKREEAKRAFNVGKGNKHPNDANLEGNKEAGQKRKAELSLGNDLQCAKGCVKAGNTSKVQKVAVHLIDRKSKGKQVITAEKVTALDRANSFKTCCNQSFLLVMKPSYIIGHGPLNFPKLFVKRHLGLNLGSDLDKNRGDIHLRVLNGTVFPVRYLIRKANTLPRFELSGGWKTFVRENKLKVGDVCIFELIQKTELTFQVHIFRETDNPDSSKSQRSSKMKAVTQGQRKPMKVTTGRKQIITAKEVKTLKRESSFKTCSSSSFNVVMHPSHVAAPFKLNLPINFGKRHLDLSKMEGDIHLQALDGRVWPARFLIKTYKRKTRIFVKAGGWKPFVKDNDLKVGDVCTFEFIPGTKQTFQVHIFRDSLGKQTIQLVQHLKNLPQREQLLKDEEIE